MKAAISLGDSLGVSAHAFYSTARKPFIIALQRENPGISCEFVIATSGEAGASQSPSVQTRLSAQIRQPSLQQQTPRNPVQEDETRVEEEEIAVRWSASRQMSPARTAGNGLEEDLYGDQMTMDEEEEILPTQQERYQGIFDV
jgi:hypothetical protein